MRIKLITICFLLLSIRCIAAEKLGMFVEVKRYFDDKKNTKFVVDYQVPYKNLLFKVRDSGFFAELKVVLSISNADSVVISKEFVNNIGVSNKYDVTNSNKSFMDRISLTLAKPGLNLNIRYEDINSQKSNEWNYSVELLNPGDRLSDIELVSRVSTDTTSFSNKYIQNGKIYVPEPSGLISRDTHDTLFVHFEAYNNSSEVAKVFLTIKKDGIDNLINSMPVNIGLNQNLLFPVNISAMGTGRYTGLIDYAEKDIKFSRNFEFIITEQSEQLYMLFSDPDEEYLLLKYLISGKNQSGWNTLSKEAKRRKVSQLWTELSSILGQPIEAVLKTYKDRVNYCNTNFSHFEKGWKTDMGRIYIRNGRPDEIDDDTSSDDTRYVRKDYQIWKYSNNNHAVYLFVDIPMNGNFKLVYAKNDDLESTYPDWQKYVGSDFDDSRLDN